MNNNTVTIYKAEGVRLVGDITFGEQCSIWYNAVIRADGASCRIGSRTNIQDLVLIHADNGKNVVLEDDVTIGHNAIIHGCTVREGTIIGMGSIIMNDAVIGRNCMVGAGSLVTERKQFPDGSLIMGSPAKLIRPLTEEELAQLKTSSPLYVSHALNELEPSEYENKNDAD